MNAEVRSRLAMAQARLVRALIGRDEVPPGFDTSQVMAAAAALLAKRRRAVAQAWPSLSQALAGTFQNRFNAFARNTPLPTRGGPLADGRAFIRALALSGHLSEAVHLQLLAVELRHPPEKQRPAWRMRLSWVHAVLPGSGRHLLGMRCAGIGERWFSWSPPLRGARAARSSGSPLADPLQVQLEGRLELIEQAYAAYAALSRLLTQLGWRSILREGPELLRSAQALESLLPEALERVARRAQQEQWSENHPLRVKVRRLSKQQARLEALANQRLIDAISVDGAGASLAEALARLELLVLSPFPEFLDPRVYDAFPGW